MNLDNFLQQEYDQLRIFLTPGVRHMIQQRANNPIAFAADHPDINEQLFDLAFAAFPGNLNTLFARAGANTPDQRFQLLTMLYNRYRDLGLPPRYRPPSISNYTSWLSDRPTMRVGHQSL